MSQSTTRDGGGRADFILLWPDRASAPAHPAYHGLSAGEPWDPNAPVWADSDSQSGWKKRTLSQEEKKKNTYTLTGCSQEYGWLKFHLKIISRALAGMYEPVEILCIEWKQTLTKVLQLHTRAHLEQCLHSDAEGDGRWKLEAGAVGCSCPSLRVFTCTFGPGRAGQLPPPA